MELNSINRQNRIERASPARRREAPAAASRSPIRADQVSLSKAAVAYLDRLNEQAREEAARQKKKEQEAAEGSGSDELDAATSALDTARKCMEIAVRIMRGDKVPPEDEAYLMRNDPEGYKLALAMRTPKKDPEEWDSILDDEEKTSGESTGEGGETGESAPSGEAAGGSGGDAPGGGDTL